MVIYSNNIDAFIVDVDLSPYMHNLAMESDEFLRITGHQLNDLIDKWVQVNNSKISGFLVSIKWSYWFTGKWLIPYQVDLVACINLTHGQSEH